MPHRHGKHGDVKAANGNEMVAWMALLTGWRGGKVSASGVRNGRHRLPRIRSPAARLNSRRLIEPAPQFLANLLKPGIVRQIDQMPPVFARLP